MSREDFWKDIQTLTERIENEDQSLSEVRLSPRTTTSSGGGDDPRRPPPPRRRRRQHSPISDAVEREVGSWRIGRLADAIGSHAVGCRGVTSFSMARSVFPDPELEARVLSTVHRFPNLTDVSLDDAPPGGGGAAAGGGGSTEFAELALDFVGIHTCWPRTRRMVLGATLSAGGGMGEPSPPSSSPSSSWVATRLGRAALLEEFSAPRLSVTQPLRWLRQTRIVETLAGLPRLTTLHLGHVGHTGQPLLGTEAMRSLARCASLETIKLVRFGVDDDGAEAFCQELLRNDPSTRLRHVEFDDFIPRITRAGCGSFWTLLRTNATVTHLHIHCTDDEEEEEPPPPRGGGADGPALAVMEADVQAMCRINRAGRRAVQADLSCASNDDWMRLLEAASDSVSASLWLLQTFPGLVSLGSRAAAPSESENHAAQPSSKRAIQRSVGPAKRRRLH